MNKIVIYLIIILAFFLLASLWGFYISVKPPRIISHITPADYQLEYEAVTFKTSDDLNLSAWFVPNKDSPNAKTIVLMHGYPADKGNILPSTRFLNEKYNLLYFDFRYLGESEGKYSSAGAKETEDLKAAIRFLKSRGIEEVGIWGLSMGGAVALMTAPESPEIKAIVSDSAYARLDLLTPTLYRIPLLRDPLGWLTGVWGKVFLGLDIKKVVPAEAAKNLSIPILIVHGTKDMVISFRHAELLQEALKNNPKAEFWFQEGISHNEFAEGYEERILDFYERNL